MVCIEPLRGSQRQTDAMEAERVVAANPFQSRQRWALADEVLRMNLQPADGGASGLELAKIGRAQADSEEPSRA